MSEVRHPCYRASLSHLFPNCDLVFSVIHTFNIESPHLFLFLLKAEVGERNFKLCCPSQFINSRFDPPDAMPITVSAGILVAITVVLDTPRRCRKLIPSAMVMMRVNKEGYYIRLIYLLPACHAINNLLRFHIVAPKSEVKVMLVIDDIDRCIIGRWRATHRYKLNKSADRLCILPRNII